MAIPAILCVTGPSGGGKTTLVERLIPALAAAGISVGVIKRSAAGLTIGAAGKDSARLAAAGARPSVAVGPHELVVERAAAVMPLVDVAATFCAGCDMVLAEGYKQSPHDKVLVLAGAEPVPPQVDPRTVRLRVTDRPEAVPGSVSRDDAAAVAAWIGGWLARRLRLRQGVIGAILVGGRSRRMGTDKAAMSVGGLPVLVRLAELLGERLGEAWLIGRPVPGVGLPQCVRWHLDLRPGLGPLGGIATALRVAGGDVPRAALVVACDMPALSGELLDLLLEQRDAALPASVLRGAGGRLEPLAAVYEPSALAHIENAFDTGAHSGAALSITRLLESIGAHAIDVPARLAGELTNVNTPEDLAGM